MSLKHVSGWLNVTGGWDGPTDPDYGHPVGPGWNPVDPGWGTRPPVDPGYGRPDWGGGRPDNELPGGGHVWGQGPVARLIQWLMNPHVSGGPIKPPGIPLLPVDPGWGVPTLPPHPWLPGRWVPVDPGYGKPPVWGFLPVDPGWGVGAPNPPVPDQGLPGHWVPIDPDYDKPIHGCAPPHPSTQPIWVWIAEIGPDFGKPKPEPK